MRPFLLLQSIYSFRHLLQAQALLTTTGHIAAGDLLLLSKIISLSSLAPWGSLPHARTLLFSSPSKSTALFNPLIRAFSASIFPAESLRLFNFLCSSGLRPNHLTFPFVLKALGRVPAFDNDLGLEPARKGSEVHSMVFRLGFGSDVFVQNSMMFMYAQCGYVDLAQKVFDEMPLKTLVSWNTLIAAYDRHGEFNVADQLLQLMPEKNVSSWNSLITRYVRVGDFVAANQVFEEMPERDAISWNTMMAGYIGVKKYKRALQLFEQMRRNEIEPTELTIVSVLGACAETGELEMGRGIHEYLKRKEVKIDGFVGNALMDMYAKCGTLKLARQVFDGVGMKHVTCWNSMIVNLAVHGHCEEALELFSCMEKGRHDAAKPNSMTFLGVLIACRHKGLVKEGQEFFNRMVIAYGLKPDIKHYGCMVDLLSRGGLVREAYRTIKEMPIRANSVMWKTVLSACRVYGDVELAEAAFEELIELQLVSDEEYILMSNIYAEAARWGDVEQLRTGTVGQSMLKPPGWSQIELN